MRNKYKIRKFRCLGCGKVVKIRRSKNNIKYCSLKCYQNSKRPQRKTGKVIKCNYCGRMVYKRKCHIEKSKELFCSLKCANLYQGREQIKFTCKICDKDFKWSKSRLKENNPTYCSINCRNKDKDWIRNACIKGNLVQQNKKGLNKLELTGREILHNLGISFKEQVLMFNKFLVDILIPSKRLIIQWDGEYWHNKYKRKQLDISQDKYFNKCGYKVLRFTDRQMKNNRNKIYETIEKLYNN